MPNKLLQVFVAPSTLPCAGEGLFAKRNLSAGALVALFNGVRQRDAGHRGAKSTNSAFTDYKIELSPEVGLDIPAACQSPARYRATLGHKCCHSFEPNAQFQSLWHPRFGHIMSVVALKPIRRGEEVLVCYNYTIQHAPVWYRDLYVDHMRAGEGRSEEFIHQWAKKNFRDRGMSVVLPPPRRDSSRY